MKNLPQTTEEPKMNPLTNPLTVFGTGLLPSEIETPVMRTFRLKDLAQQYYNMLTCIHGMEPGERAQAEKRQAETDTKIQDLNPPQDA